MVNTMKNTIDVHVEFDFKGESYSPSATIDLDSFLESNRSFPLCHAILADENGIDTYSYLYEAMQQTEIQFDNAQGLAAEFLKDGIFDEAAFIAKWHANRAVQLLQPIVKRELGIDDLEQHAGLKNALIQAYELGKCAGGSES